jgi:hypothetical protein
MAMGSKPRAANRRSFPISLNHFRPWQWARRFARRLARRSGYDIVRHQPATTKAPPAPDAERITVARYLIPSGHKLIDFREEAGFNALAGQVIAAGRTLLDYNRLLTLWHAARNVRGMPQAAAEVGTFRGGSAWFLAAALEHWQMTVPVHVVDTFSGHPDVIQPALDGPHTMETFADTSLEAVQLYLAQFPAIRIHPGEFTQVSAALADEQFCLVHLDVDLHQSAAATLQFFWPRLAVGGIIVVDDYGFTTCRGLKVAVDDFVAQAADCSTWYVHTGQLILTKRAPSA